MWMTSRAAGQAVRCCRFYSSGFSAPVLCSEGPAGFDSGSSLGPGGDRLWQERLPSQAWPWWPCCHRWTAFTFCRWSPDLFFYLAAAIHTQTAHPQVNNGWSLLELSGQCCPHPSFCLSLFPYYFLEDLVWPLPPWVMRPGSSRWQGSGLVFSLPSSHLPTWSKASDLLDCFQNANSTNSKWIFTFKDPLTKCVSKVRAVLIWQIHRCHWLSPSYLGLSPWALHPPQ